MNRRERQQIRNLIVELLDKAKDDSLSRRERSRVRGEIVENFKKLGVGMKSNDQVESVSTPSFDMIKAGKVSEDNIVELIEKAFQELLDSGSDEQSAVEAIKRPLIDNIRRIDADSDVIQEALDLLQQKADEEEDEDEGEDEGEDEEEDPENFDDEGEDPEDEDEDDEDDDTIQEALFMPPPAAPKQVKSLAQRGVYFLDEEIRPHTVGPIIREIMQHNIVKKVKHITLVVSSNGGDVEAAMGLIDTMKGSDIPVHTVAMGRVKSAGLLIAMSGSKGHRTIMPNTSVMSHEFSAGFQGNKSALQAAGKRISMLASQLTDFYAENTGLDTETINKELMGPTDRWLTAKEAIEFGMFDAIEKGDFYKDTTIQESAEEPCDDEPEDDGPEGTEENEEAEASESEGITQADVNTELEDGTTAQVTFDDSGEPGEETGENIQESVQDEPEADEAEPGGNTEEGEPESESESGKEEKTDEAA